MHMLEIEWIHLAWCLAPSQYGSQNYGQGQGLLEFSIKSARDICRMPTRFDLGGAGAVLTGSDW